jgi:hypothetical protein
MLAEHTRETKRDYREWPLLAVDTEHMGTHRVQMKGGPSLVVSLGLP